LLFRIHQEIGLPLTPPGVACISTMYYFFHPFTNVIFVPVGESEFLLHLPDLFHEIGHEISCNKENESRLKGVHGKYTLAVHKITEYYGQLLTKKRRETGPSEIPRLIMHIHSQWKNWIEEFFSDLFALYTVGPAYAWSHLHITIKKSQNVYDFSPILPRTHPSDDGRMRMLIIGMGLVGFEDEAKTIWSKWKNMPLTTGTQPVVEYQYVYPEELMTEVASAILQGIKESGFAIVLPKRLNELNEKSVIKLLNEAWDLFWKEPNGFRSWEEKKILYLKETLQ